MTTPTNTVVRAFVDAINSDDRPAFDALLAPDVTMSDDGTDRDVRDWVQKEIFGAHGRMQVTEQSADGLRVRADFTNSTWGTMHTRWAFTITDGTIVRFETGQA